MPLRIHTSNQMEILLEQLAQVVRTPLPSPFARETIVVQSKGMQRWLSMELARLFGVWANCEYPFPNKMVELLFEAVVPGYQEGHEFAPETMTWRLMTLLAETQGRPGFEELAGYLNDDRDGLKRLQLAQRIADNFDRYTVYRPEMVLRWEQGEDAGWQAELWRDLTRECGAPHRARLLSEFRAAIRTAPQRLPTRISLIGIPTLPPFHMEVFASVARYTEVNLFLLNPCRQYWGRIVSEKELARLEQQGAQNDAWYETGNPLLASLGKVGREFFDALIGDLDTPDCREEFCEPPGDTLLHRIQGEILDLREPGPQRLRVATDDRSLLIHSCHSPMREVEVLHDTLLDLFQADPTLTPRDVLVMTPDIEGYAPYVSAVFDTPETGSQPIPYSIADRSPIDQGEGARALLALLRLCGGRFGVASVLDLLESKPVARRFSLSDSELETVRHWLKATNVRWGIDAAQRGAQGLPDFGENSWQAGLDRLLLGYALDGAGESFFNGILPYDDLEGGESLVLGRLASFCQLLFQRCRELEEPRPLPEWVKALRALIADFLHADGEGERELQELTELAGKLGEQGGRGGFTGMIGIDAVRYWLKERLAQSRPGFGFLTGGVTFCAMLPMRSIPFRVVALIGMNDGAFPRRNASQGFDLIGQAPQRGDRSQRDEDRYLFLEALLSARDRLHLSYLGQSVKDNGELPPSVLVSELLDYLERGFVRDDAVQFLLRHPLQPFSPSYFSGSPWLFSYSAQNCRGARARKAPLCALPPFLSRPLERLNEEETVTLKALVDFLCNPARELLRRRLGIRVDQGVEALDECEPFALNPLVRYQLEQEMVRAQVRGVDPELPFAVFRGRGEIPPGECGRALYDKLSGPAAEFAAKVVAALAAEPLPPLDVELELEGGRLTGRIEGIRSDRLVIYRYTKLKAKDLLRLWVQHLALNCAAVAGYPTGATFLASDATVHLPPVAQSRMLLERLLGLYRKGMAFPLRFFPETSFEYAKKSRDPKKAHKALSDARGKWVGSEFYPGEGSDHHFRGCFGEEEPLDEEFMATALEIWEPILGHQTKGK